MTIDERISFIHLILDGTIKITNKKIDYPWKMNKNKYDIYNLKNSTIPYDILDFFKDNCFYLDVFKGKSSFPFCIVASNFKLAVKISYFSTNSSHFKLELKESLKHKSIYLKKNNISSKKEILYNTSLNIENIILNKLSKLVYKKYTPHINLPILCFKTQLSKLKDNLLDYPPIMKRINECELIDDVNVYLSEWCNLNNLKDYLNKYNFHIHFDVILFQIISVLVIIQEIYPSFRHNDLHLRNILVEKLCTKDERHFLYDYIIEGKRYIFSLNNIGIQIRIWDFDWSNIGGIVHNNKMSLTKLDYNKQNRSFDLVYFMHYLENYYLKKSEEKVDLRYVHFFRDIRKGIDIHKDIHPQKKNVLKVDKEFQTPLSILKKHSLEGGIFYKFIYDKISIRKNKFIDIYKYP